MHETVRYGCTQQNYVHVDLNEDLRATMVDQHPEGEEGKWQVSYAGRVGALHKRVIMFPVAQDDNGSVLQATKIQFQARWVADRHCPPSQRTHVSYDVLSLPGRSNGFVGIVLTFIPKKKGDK